jgi:hypothetical protein
LPVPNHCFFTCSGVQHMYCDFALFSSSCVPYVASFPGLPLRYSLTFIYELHISKRYIITFELVIHMAYYFHGNDNNLRLHQYRTGDRFALVLGYVLLMTITVLVVVVGWGNSCESSFNLICNRI